MVKMLPTPAKFHYMFNMRELSRVFQGILTAPRETITDDKYLVALWRHECERVMCDKLTSKEDKTWVLLQMNKVIEGEFGRELAKLMIERPPFYVNFMRDPVFDDEGICIEEHPLVYEKVADIAVLHDRVHKYMTQMNSEVKVGKLDLVLFEGVNTL